MPAVAAVGREHELDDVLRAARLVVRGLGVAAAVRGRRHGRHGDVALREEEAIAARHEHLVAGEEVARDDEVHAVVPLAKDLVRVAVRGRVHRGEDGVLGVLERVRLERARPVVHDDVLLQRAPRLAKVRREEQVLEAEAVRLGRVAARRERGREQVRARCRVRHELAQRVRVPHRLVAAPAVLGQRVHARLADEDNHVLGLDDRRHAHKGCAGQARLGAELLRVQVRQRVSLIRPRLAAVQAAVQGLG